MNDKKQPTVASPIEPVVMLPALIIYVQNATGQIAQLEINEHITTREKCG